MPIKLLCFKLFIQSKHKAQPHGNWPDLITSSFCSPSPLVNAPKEQCTLKCNYLFMYLFFYLYFQYHRVKHTTLNFKLNNLLNCRNIHLSGCSLYIYSANINLLLCTLSNSIWWVGRTMHHRSCHNPPHLCVMCATDQRPIWQSILNLDYRLFCLLVV